MELNEILHYRKLKKLYAMDVAIAKQDYPELFDGLEDVEAFKSLLLIDDNAKIVSAVNEHLEYDSDADTLCAICSMLVMTAYKLLDESRDCYDVDTLQKIRNIVHEHEDLEVNSTN